MKHSLIAWKIVDVLRQCDNPRRAANKLAGVIGEVLRTESTHLFLCKRASLQDLASSGGSAASEVVDLARACIATLEDRSTADYFGCPLTIEGLPVGALVLGDSDPQDRSFLPVIRNLAALLLLACGGVWQDLLDLQDFHAVVRLERQRGQRTGLPFSLISLSAKDRQTLPPAAFQALRTWVRDVDTLGELDRNHTGVLLPDTEAAGARIAASRIMKLLQDKFDIAAEVSFIVVPPEVAEGDEEAVAEEETPLTPEGTQWTSVQDVC